MSSSSSSSFPLFNNFRQDTQASANEAFLSSAEAEASSITYTASSSSSSSSSNGYPFEFLNRPEVTSYRLIDWAFILLLLVIWALLFPIPPHRQVVNSSVLSTDPAELNRFIDPSFAYPLRDQTVPVVYLILLAIALPLVVFFSFYYQRYRQIVSNPHLSSSSSAAALQRAKSNLNLEYQSLFLAFALCILVNVICTDAIKKFVGRPRPNMYEMVQWSNGDVGVNASSSEIREAFQSYVSGHSSLSFAGLFFLSQFLFQHLSSLSPLYIATQLALHKTPATQIVRVNNIFSFFIPFLPLILATWIGLTRITDYWHRELDVTAGCILGTFIAFVTFQYCYLERKWTWLHLHPLPQLAQELSEHHQHSSAGELDALNSV